MQQNYRVLLVEDDDSLRVCLSDFLADHGWQVAATARGEEAIAMARCQRFDFSILDFHLPDGTTGLEVFRTIRQIHPLPGILMSGAASRNETDEARRAGFFTFLRKPLQLQILRQTVQMLIEHHFATDPRIRFQAGRRLPPPQPPSAPRRQPPPNGFF